MESREYLTQIVLTGRNLRPLFKYLQIFLMHIFLFYATVSVLVSCSVQLVTNPLNLGTVNFSFSKPLVGVYRLQHLTFSWKGVLKLEASASQHFLTGEPGSQKTRVSLWERSVSRPTGTAATKSHVFSVEKLGNMSQGKK